MRTKKASVPTLSLEDTCNELRSLQRMRAVVMKSRIMQANRLQAIVAGEIGYSSKMTDKERLKKFAEADVLIKEIASGGGESFRFRAIVQTTLIGIDAFNDLQAGYETRMIAYAKTLPVSSWVEEPEQRGFGIKSLGILVGECGNLSNYPTVACVWRRMCCAPWHFSPAGEPSKAKTLMGATWRGGKEGKLPKEEWELYGYSPRRRSIAFLFGQGLVKQNETGPYRARYDYAKSMCRENHPDYSDMRCHLHGMLLATKLLLKRTWVEWNGKPRDAEYRWNGD